MVPLHESRKEDGEAYRPEISQAVAVKGLRIWSLNLHESRKDDLEAYRPLSSEMPTLRVLLTAHKHSVVEDAF